MPSLEELNGRLTKVENTAMTIVAPATPSVIWRISAGYLNAP